MTTIRRTTITDVALKAGVSISTVSRVLNGKGVKQSTHDKIMETIDALGYSPDLVARSMAGKETKMIGLLVPTLTNEFWALLSEAIQDELWLEGYGLMLCSSNFELEREETFLQMFTDRKVDGVIFGASSPSLGGNDFGHIAEWKRKYRIPFVSLDPNIPDVSGVVGDHLQSAMIAVQHLISLGHRNIAYIGGPAVSIDRELGYRKALIMSGLSMHEGFIKLGSGQSFDFGYAALKELLDSKEPFSAVFCGNDLIAMGAIHALNESGLRVPEDVGIVGYDDIHLAGMLKPSLTTVRQPIRQISQESILLLQMEMESEVDTSISRKILISNELIIRDSCGAHLRLTST